MNKNHKICKFYLTIKDEDTGRASTKNDLPDAFINGFIAAMHKTRTHSPVFTSRDRIDRINIIEQALKNMPKAHDFCRKYIRPDINDIGRHCPMSMLRKAFVQGYMAGVHASGKYDHVLYADSEREATLIIAGDLIALEEKWNNACQAAARITLREYGNTSFASQLDPDAIV